jgi:predicted RNase H-like HicB family nuclease
MRDYHINIFWSDEDSGYIADIPDLVSCSAFGATPREALEQVMVAREAWIEAAQQEGKPVPPPRYRPLIYHVAG